MTSPAPDPADADVTVAEAIGITMSWSSLALQWIAANPAVYAAWVSWVERTTDAEPPSKTALAESDRLLVVLAAAFLQGSSEELREFVKGMRT